MTIRTGAFSCEQSEYSAVEFGVPRAIFIWSVGVKGHASHHRSVWVYVVNNTKAATTINMTIALILIQHSFGVYLIWQMPNISPVDQQRQNPQRTGQKQRHQVLPQG